VRIDDLLPVKLCVYLKIQILFNRTVAVDRVH